MQNLKTILDITKSKLRAHITYTNSHSFLVYCLIFIAIISVIFNIRVIFDTRFAFFLGEKKDFTINFFYLSDVICFTLLIFRLNKTRDTANRTSVFLKIPLFISIIAIVSYLYNFKNLTVPIISIFYLLYITKWAVLHETIRDLSKGIQAKIIAVLWIFGLFEAFLSIIQFGKQSSIGLKFLGEPTFGPYIWGIAKVEALGQTFSRPYGTLLHPNVLAATLVLTLCIGFYYYYQQNRNQNTAWIHLFLIQITLIAIFISFSRAAWLAAMVAIGLIHVFTWNYLKNKKLKQVLHNAIVSTAVCILLLNIYQPFVKQRGNVFDKAYHERVNYNKAAIAMIAHNPLFGLGPGESVLHMEQFLSPTAKPWEIQPIHNYYLLLAAELGLPATLLFLVYVVYVFNKLSLNKANITQAQLLWRGLIVAGLGGCLTLMFFDHYFYTLQTPMLLFSLWLALAASVSELDNHSNPST